MTHTQVFKKYYIYILAAIRGQHKFILNYKTRGRTRRVTLIKYNKRIRWKANKMIHDI